MRSRLAVFLAALALTAVPARALSAGILDVIPAATPAFVVFQNPSALEAEMRSLFPAAMKNAPTGGALSSILGFQGPLQGIDLNGPLVVAMPVVPFPLFGVSVLDYDQFLATLASPAPGQEAPPAPQSPVPGVDMAVISGKPMFLRNEGKFALLSPMPILLTPSAPGSGVTTILSEPELASLEESDVFLRLDVGTILTLVEPMLNSYLASMEKPPESPPDGETPPAGGPPDELKQLLAAETDFIMAWLRQIRSFSFGTTITDGNVLFSSLTRPVAASTFETILGQMAPGSHEMLDFFDSDAAWAGAFRINPDAFTAMVPAMIDFMTNSGVYNLTAADMEEWKRIATTAFEVSGEESAFSIGSSRSAGAFSTLALARMKNAGEARQMMKDSFLFAEKILAASVADEEFELDMEVQITEEIEVYKGVPIDSIRISLIPPGGDKETAREFDAIMESMFGGSSLGIWVAFVEDFMLASYYAPTSEELKEFIDRVREARHGSLTGSAAFRTATGNLPPASLSLSYFSFPRFVSLMMSMVEKMVPGEKIPPWPLKDEDLSGLGIAVSSPGGSLKIDTYLPREEVENIRLLMDYLKSLEPAKKKSTL